jgi:S1-C subfamily serine protease
MRRGRRFLAVALATASLAACSHRDQYEPRTRLPGVDGEPAAPAAGATPAVRAWMYLPGEAGVAGAGQETVASFAAEVTGKARAGSLGCLPLVMYDSDHAGPWVPELGVALADEAADLCRGPGFGGTVLGTADMAVRLSQVNLEKVSLTSLEAVAAAGDRLGVDVVLFGTLRREKDSGTAFLQRIKVHLLAYSFPAGALVGERKFELRSDAKENARAYAAAKAESLWMPGTAWEVPAAGKSLDQELRVIAGILAKRALQAVRLEDIQGAIYIPPADTGRFVRSVARLRAAQAAFSLEYAARAKEVAKGEDPLAVERPVTLNGTEFKSLQAAFSHLAMLREQLLSSETARFSQTVSSVLAEAVRPMTTPRAVLLDVGFTKASDMQLLEGELGTGGLARSLRAREALREQKIDLVAAPKIERIGANYALRVEIYDLAKPNMLATSSVRIEPRFADELRRALDVDELAPIDDLPGAERTTWEKVYEKASRSVVSVENAKGRGSGFVVGATGLLMTNSHVVAGCATGRVLFADGTGADYTLVKDDPKWDLAIVKVASLPAGVEALRFAPEEKARVGADVAVLGHPMNTAGWVLTPGSLSSVRETCRTPGGERPSLMYTCPTRAGNSGSPVLLADGTVVAVHAAGNLGTVKGADGKEIYTQGGDEVRSELTGCAQGGPGGAAARLLGESSR